jgi:hypothetical protein
VGQDKIVVGVEQRQLLTQSRFVFVQRVDPPANGRHMLTKIQIQALDEGGIDLPTPLGQDGLDGLCRTEDDAVCDPDDVPAPVALDHLRIEQPGQRHPPGFELRPFGLAARGVNPLAVMGDERGEIRGTRTIGANSPDFIVV